MVCNASYSNDRLKIEVGDEYFYADVDCHGEYYYYHGDWENPPEEELTINSITVISIQNEDGEYVDVTLELKTAAEEAVYDVSWEDWSK